MRTQASVLHVDLDAFFAAVEQRDKPSLRGKPVVVGGIGGRGVVATASYEARAFGVGSAMPTAEARRRCPHAAYLAGRFPAYRTASQAVLGLLRDVSPLVEAVSLDEAYVDLSPTHPDVDAGTAARLAEELRAGIRRETGLTASVGAGTSKLIAKVASDLRKPDAVTVVPPGREAATLAPLPVRRLPGIGPASEERLRVRGISTVGQLAALDVADLVELLGSAHGTATSAAARGVDDRAVVPERDAKSISTEETFSQDLVHRDTLEGHLRRMAEHVSGRLQFHATAGRTVTLKIRRHDFTTLTRSTTLPHPTSSAREVAAAVVAMLGSVDTSDGVRLLGVGVAGLTGYQQPLLLDDAEVLKHPEPVAAPRPPAPTDSVPVGAGAGAVPQPPTGSAWRPGQDVAHAGHGPGWVQGSGLGRVTVRFEGPHTRPGPVRTFAADDPDLVPADPPEWTPPR